MEDVFSSHDLSHIAETIGKYEALFHLIRAGEAIPIIEI